MFNIAASHHNTCFICSTSIKKTKLCRFNVASVGYAFLTHEMVIKNHARCCSRHLDESGRIKKEEFYLIPTSKQYLNPQKIAFIMNLLKGFLIHHPIEQSGVFDLFKDIASLSETDCIKITGWKKIEFVDFSNYVTGVLDTADIGLEKALIRHLWLCSKTKQVSNK